MYVGQVGQVNIKDPVCPTLPNSLLKHGSPDFLTSMA
jgi:hypothetical protein